MTPSTVVVSGQSALQNRLVGLLVASVLPSHETTVQVDASVPRHAVRVSASPEDRWLIVSFLPDIDQDTIQVFSDGASALLSINDSEGDFVRGFDVLIHGGEPYIAPGSVRQLATTRLRGSEESPLPQPLTPREEEVLGLVLLGHSNAEIARMLYLSPNTVRTHVANLFRKVGVSNRNRLIARGRSGN